MRVLRTVFSLCRRNLSKQVLGMETHKVVPDVIDVVPANIIQVKYDSGVEANLGNELTPTQVQNKPTIHFEGESGSLYTFCLTDPDAPSRAEPKFGEWLHWLIVNVPGNDLSKGETISDYIGSGPPKGTGLHRYIFLAYKQPDKLTCDEPRHTSQSGKQRNNFKIRDFAKKYKLGNPVAANFYQAQWDDYVPKLYEQIKD